MSRPRAQPPDVLAELTVERGEPGLPRRHLGVALLGVRGQPHRSRDVLTAREQVLGQLGHVVARQGPNLAALPRPWPA
jgi:hypothetical protein